MVYVAMSIKQKVALIIVLAIATVGFLSKATYAADATMSTSGNITYHDGVYARVAIPSGDVGFNNSGCKDATDLYLKPNPTGGRGVEVICFYDGSPAPVSYYRYISFPNAIQDPNNGSVSYGGSGNNNSGGGGGSYRTITVAPASTTSPGSVSSSDPNPNGGDSEPSGTNSSNNGSNTSTGNSTGSDVPQAPTYDEKDQGLLEDTTDCTKSTDPNVKCCGKVKTSVLNFVCKDSEDPITKILFIVLNVLTAAIGIAAVGGIGYGALLYTTAQNSPEQTKRAISIITNVVIGIVAYGLMYVLLNFLVPGGVFS